MGQISSPFFHLIAISSLVFGVMFMKSNRDLFPCCADSSGRDDKSIISDFRRWLRTIPPCQYTVSITQRASNLVEIIQKENPDVLPNYITENGILLQAEKIAEAYHQTGRFPTIAVVDDILVYGRRMNLFLSRLWNTILRYLDQLGIDTEQTNAEEAFLESISLWVYAINDAPILLRHEYQWILHGQHMMPENGWRSLSGSIAKLITEEDVANTSYVISAKLPDGAESYRPSAAAWVSDGNVRYRRNEQRYEFYLFRQAAKFGVYPSVRSYRKQGNIYYTPYFFMSELTWAQTIRILTTLFDFSAEVDVEATNECINLLNQTKDCASRMMVYAQFAILLLSQVTLSVFFNGAASNLEPKIEYDVEKISRNFAIERNIASTLRSFCRIRWNENQLLTLLKCLDSPKETVNARPLQEARTPGGIMNIVERLVYRQAVDHERDAVGRKRYRFSDAHADRHINQTGEQDLWRFLSRVREESGTGMDISSMSYILSCLTQMMDMGDVSLKARSKRREGMQVFYSSVRTTEISLAIMPRKLAGYYKQFYLLAQIYWRDHDFPDRVESYFRDAIFAGDPEGKNAVMISNARYFAQLISENRMIAKSMLNWNDLLD